MVISEGLELAMVIDVLHEEKHFLVCIKPCGVLSENSDGKTDGMVDLLSAQTESEIYPVHRLDREASGVMVYAKTKAGASKLSALVSGDGFEKVYLAVVHGVPQEKAGVMEDYLFKDSKKNKSFVVKKERKGVKYAKLEYQTVDTKEMYGETFSLVKIKLHTGRTHQIRVQFSSRNMPLAGDSRYGSTIKTEMCLFSHSIGFTNPFNGKAMLFTAKPDGALFNTFN